MSFASISFRLQFCETQMYAAAPAASPIPTQMGITLKGVFANE